LEALEAFVEMVELVAFVCFSIFAGVTFRHTDGGYSGLAFVSVVAVFYFSFGSGSLGAGVCGFSFYASIFY